MGQPGSAISAVAAALIAAVAPAGEARAEAPEAELVATAESPWRPQFGMSFSSGVPMGGFAERVNDPGYGVGLFAGLGLPNLPVVLGAEFSFLTYGRQASSEILHTSIGNVHATLTTTNQVVMGHFLVRIQPRSGAVRPYLDALIGFKNFSTESRLSVPEFDPNDPSATVTIATKTQLADTALSYGIGAGLDVQLRRWQQEEGDSTALYLDVGAGYLFGSEANYLKEGSIRGQGDELVVDVLHSRTDMLVAQIGLKLEF